MKSQASVIFHVVDGLFLDACRAYPELRGEFLKDKERIARTYQHRGLATFTLDLPALDPVLLAGLESGRLTLGGPLSSRVSPRIRVPKLFRGLWLRVFDKESCLLPDPDETAVAFLRQFLCLGKKLRVECSHERIQIALRNYHDVEKSLRRPTLEWSSDTIGEDWKLDSLHFANCLPPSNGVRHLFSEIEADREGQHFDRDRHLLNKLQHVADAVVSTFTSIEPLLYSYSLELEGKGTGFRHGRGAVAERLRNHEKSRFPNWPHKLQDYFPFEYCGKTIGDDRDRPPNHEVPSRLLCVPKTAKGPRIIAAEPVAHMWCQQLVLSWMESQFRTHFKGFFIDLTAQHKSGEMVSEASRSRSHATVDLSDASDRLTCWTVERAFRKNKSLLRVLHAARTRYLRETITEKAGSFIKLKKFASQGTATTFPVQSLVFLIIAIASCIGEGEVTWPKIWKLRNDVRVYGDDIILPSHGYVRLIRYMELLQLKVNVAKSYVDGEFRESCGTDCFRGYDVTPVKPEVIVADGPASCQAVIDTSNNLFYKGYWNASHYLTQTLPPYLQGGLRVVGKNDAGFTGLAAYSGSDESHLAKRWNKRLHRYEVRVFRIHEKTRQGDREGFASLLDFVSRPHNHEHARITGEYDQSRKVKVDLLWEPLNYSGRSDHTRLPRRS
jgi:hypothetical protein